MAIGFTVTNITDKKVIPDKTLTIQQSPRVRIQKFGDGYEQRLAEGINNIVNNFTITLVNRAKAEADDIIAFFEAKAGVTAFEFTYPDTNSTSVTTAVLASSPSNSLTIALTAANLDISVGATLTGGGVDGTPKVTENQAPNTTVIVDTAQTINTGSDGTALTFTNPNERTIKVVCEDWTLNYSSSGFYTIQTSFRRVYEP